MRESHERISVALPGEAPERRSGCASLDPDSKEKGAREGSAPYTILALLILLVAWLSSCTLSVDARSSAHADILGEWILVGDPEVRCYFSEDGGFATMEPTGTSTGRYRMLDPQTIDVTLGQFEVRLSHVSFTADKLTYSYQEQIFEYMRAPVK